MLQGMLSVLETLEVVWVSLGRIYIRTMVSHADLMPSFTTSRVCSFVLYNEFLIFFTLVCVSPLNSFKGVHKGWGVKGTQSEIVMTRGLCSGTTIFFGSFSLQYAYYLKVTVTLAGSSNHWKQKHCSGSLFSPVALKTGEQCRVRSGRSATKAEELT